jgi:hypothetical protein
MWKLGYLNAPEISFKQVSLALLVVTSFLGHFILEIFTKQRRHIELPQVNISDVGSL